MSVEALETGFVAERDTGAFARAGVLRRLARDRVAAVAALALTVIVLAALLRAVDRALRSLLHRPHQGDAAARAPSTGSAPTIPAATS